MVLLLLTSSHLLSLKRLKKSCSGLDEIFEGPEPLRARGVPVSDCTRWLCGCLVIRSGTATWAKCVLCFPRQEMAVVRLGLQEPVQRRAVDVCPPQRVCGGQL